MADTPEEPRNVERELDELREQLIEQEHRGFRILTNFFIEKKKWSKGDPRHAAAWKALLYRLWFSPGSIAAAGGLVGFASVALLFGQYRQMALQNKEFREQTSAIVEQTERQNERFRLQRRTELIAILYEGKDGEETIDGATFDHKVPKANARTRSEALKEFVQLERMRLNKNRNRESISGVDVPLVDLARALLDNVDANQTDLKHVDLRGANLSGAYLDSADLTGALLVGANLHGADLSGANLPGVPLSEADLSGAILSDANLKGADIRGANLSGADLSDADLSGADAFGTNLKGADLFNAALGDASLFEANLDGANLFGRNSLSCLQLQSAKNFELAFRREDLSCGKPIPDQP